jgi:hypothetical protein
MLPLREIFVRILLFHSLSIIPSKLHSHLHLILLLPEPKNEKNGSPSKNILSENVGSEH